MIHLEIQVNSNAPETVQPFVVSVWLDALPAHGNVLQQRVAAETLLDWKSKIEAALKKNWEISARVANRTANEDPAGTFATIPAPTSAERPQYSEAEGLLTEAYGMLEDLVSWRAWRPAKHSGNYSLEVPINLCLRVAGWLMRNRNRKRSV